MKVRQQHQSIVHLYGALHQESHHPTKLRLDLHIINQRLLCSPTSPQQTQMFYTRTHLTPSTMLRYF